MATVIEKKKFIFASVGDNHNKFWLYELYDNDDVRVQWGRIGKGTQSKTHSGAGKHFADSKSNEKINKGYKEVDILDAEGGAQTVSATVASSSELKNIAKNQIKHSNPEVAALIDYLVKVNQHNIYNATGGKVEWNSAKGLFVTPLGIVTPASIAEARTLLVSLGDCVAKKDWKSKGFISTLEEYMTLIPQDIGMKFNPQNIFPDLSTVQKQGAVLDALEASYQTVTTAPKATDDAPKKDAPKLFDLELSKLDDKGILKSIKDMYEKTRKGMHSSSSYGVKYVYEVAMPFQATLYEKVAKEIDGVQRLWHGTSSANLLSILKSGLRKSPPSSAYVSGKMYGSGCYFSSESTKSLNYAVGYWGGNRSDRTFMFLADVAMGNYFVPKGPTSSPPPKGYHSYWAKAGQSGVLNHEMVIFNDNQCLLKFLIEFE